MPKIKIVPAILSANPDTLQQDLNEIEQLADLLQVDVMDNVFVPNKTKQAELLRTFTTSIPLDIHLMVQEPRDDYLLGFIKANTDLRINNITVHIEACKDINHQIEFIKKNKIKPAVAINPQTPVEKIKDILDHVDMVLVMTVQPGFSGQSFIREALPKVTEIRNLKPNLDIEVDGGITDKTAPLAAKAGANVFVANSFVFKSENKVEAIKRLRESVQ